MRRFTIGIALVLLSLTALHLLAQAPGQVITTGAPNPKLSSGAPTGTCGQQDTDVDTTTGNFYACNAGTWKLAGGGGGNGTVNSGTANQLTYYAATGTAVSGNSNITTNAAGALILKNGPWIDPIAYGADPTGVADSQTAIQNAINVCKTTSGIRVQLGPGTYLFTPPLVIPIDCTNVSIVGAGGAAYQGGGTTLLVKTGVTNADGIRVENNSDFLQGFTIDGQNRTTGSCNNGIVFHNDARGHLVDVQTINCTLDGMLIDEEPAYGTVNISSISRTSNTVTVVTSAAHGLAGGSNQFPCADIAGVTGMATSPNGLQCNYTVTNTTTFTFSQSGANESGSGGTVSQNGNNNKVHLETPVARLNGKHGIESGTTPGVPDLNHNSVVIDYPNVEQNHVNGIELHGSAGNLWQIRSLFAQGNQGWPLKIGDGDAVNTTLSLAISSTGVQTITPISMTNINKGSVLAIDTGANQEWVAVLSTSGGTFSANVLKTHNSGAAVTASVDNSYVVGGMLMGIADMEANGGDQCVLAGHSVRNLLFLPQGSPFGICSYGLGTNIAIEADSDVNDSIRFIYGLNGDYIALSPADGNNWILSGSAGNATAGLRFATQGASANIVLAPGTSGAVEVNQGNLALNAAGVHLNTNAASNDFDGTISISAATTGTHAFSTNYSSRPACTWSTQGDPGSGVRYWDTSATNQAQITFSVSVTLTAIYHCGGNPN